MLQFKELIFIILAFVWVVIGSNYVAKLFQRIKLPLITGFLISGIIIGPYGIDLIKADSIEKLHFINYTSLAFIAFVAGSELYFKEIRNSLKSIVWNTLGQLFVIFLLVSISVYYLEELIPFMKNMNEIARLSVAILTGTIFIARSPSSTIAVINELRAKGRFTRMVISVTVLLDVLVIVLFTICLSLVQNLITDVHFNFLFIFLLIIELVLTLILGFIIAKLIEFFLFISLSNYIKLVFILILGFSIYQLTIVAQFTHDYLNKTIHIEPLLVCIIASFWITNYSQVGLYFQKLIKDLSPLVYVAFFTLVGASLSIDILYDMWKIAVVLFLIYIVSLIIGSITGNVIAKNPKIYRRIGWMPFITQAGVGFALVYEVSEHFPEWGNQLATIIIAVIILNQVIGPPLFKWSLKLVGESRHHAKTDMEPNRNAIVFGLERQSLDLAHNLQKDHYDVEIACIDQCKKADTIKNVHIHYLDFLNMKCLNEINISKFDVVVLMLSDEENLKICELIYENIGTQIVVVRLLDSMYADKFRDLGALVVDPSTAIIRLLEQFVRSPITTSMILGDEDHKAMVDFKVLDLELHGMALRDLRLPDDVIIISVKRRGQILISHGYTRLRIGDIVTMVGSLESLEHLSLQFQE